MDITARMQINMDLWDGSNDRLLSTAATYTSATAFTTGNADDANDDDDSWNWAGRNLTFSGGDPTGGTVTGATDYDYVNGPVWMTLEDFELSANTLATITIRSFFRRLMTGTDSVVGSNADDMLWGYGGNDVLRSNAGNDTLVGGAGADRLTGGTGADQFKFTVSSEGGDTITDFSASQRDRLVFVSPNFGNISTGTLGSSLFCASSTGAASNRTQRFLFNTSNGVLKYDPDGNSSRSAVTIATLNVRTLAASQISIVSS